MMSFLNDVERQVAARAAELLRDESRVVKDAFNLYETPDGVDSSGIIGRDLDIDPTTCRVCGVGAIYLAEYELDAEEMACSTSNLVSALAAELRVGDHSGSIGITTVLHYCGPAPIAEALEHLAGQPA
jgi:hypothetical protein